jgi:hypothetical protein
MAVVALIVSVLALLVAGASAWYARSQAHAQAEATGIERDRRQAERRPTFDAEIEDVNDDGGFYRLWLTLTSPEPLDGISVELPPACVFVFASNISGVRDRRHAESYEGEINPGRRACWRIELSGDWKEESLLVEARRGAAKWGQRVTVKVP